MELVLEAMWKVERWCGEGTETVGKLWTDRGTQTLLRGFLGKRKQLGESVWSFLLTEDSHSFVRSIEKGNKGHIAIKIRKGFRYFFRIIVEKKSTAKWSAISGGQPGDRTESDCGSDYQQKAAALLDRYGNSILRLSYSYLHNLADAEDILQDTLVQYLKIRPVLETPAHEKAWLLTVAANLSKNRISYNQVRQADELQEELAAEEREDLSFVWEAVRALPEKYREVIHLFHYEGCSTAQIAQMLDRKESTVRSELRRGRQRLKEILKEAYDFE